MTKSPTSKESLTGSILQRFKRRLWNVIVESDMYEELRREVVYGEVRMVFHDGRMKDLFIQVHGHERDNDLNGT